MNRKKKKTLNYNGKNKLILPKNKLQENTSNFVPKETPKMQNPRYNTIFSQNKVCENMDIPLCVFNDTEYTKS